jgi:hypothetical protein
MSCYLLPNEFGYALVRRSLPADDNKVVRAEILTSPYQGNVIVENPQT